MLRTRREARSFTLTRRPRSRGERSSKGTGLVAATQTPRVREYKLCMRADGRPDDDFANHFYPVSTRGVLTSIPHRFIIAGSRDARCTTTCNVALLNVVVNDNGCRVLLRVIGFEKSLYPETLGQIHFWLHPRPRRSSPPGAPATRLGTRQRRRGRR